MRTIMMKQLIRASLLFYTILMAVGAANAAPLYFPHIATIDSWQTEIAMINTSSDQSVTGTLKAYSDVGQHVESKEIWLAARSRREIIIANEFTNHASIGYIVLDTTSDMVEGYTKFYKGDYRVAIPAVREVNTSDIYVTHIASDAEWWTGISLVNTTAAAKTLTLTFSDGQSEEVTLAANGHKAFAVKDLFNGVPQPSIQSAVLTPANGIIGLELFATHDGKQMEGILLTDRTATSLFYPCVSNDTTWWTGIVAYNPFSSPCNITVTSYDIDGNILSTPTDTIDGGEKYIGTPDQLGLPAQTAWFRLDATGALSGFELIGTRALDRLASFAGNGGSGSKAGVLAKIEKNGGKTEIALANTENGTASVNLTAYTNAGTPAANSLITLGGHAAVADDLVHLFRQDLTNATYIAYASDRNIVGLQLNYSTDERMLDGLPALGITGGNGSSGGQIYTCSDGTHCPSPLTCSAGNECKCPAGQQLCRNICIPQDASCCYDGSYCVGTSTCGSDNSCTDYGTGMPSGPGVVGGMTYFMFANGCADGMIYGYTGPNYTICNAYVTLASSFSLCSKIINACHGLSD